MHRNILMLSVATAEGGIASSTVSRRTLTSLTTPVARSWAGVLCRGDILFRAMSCLLKRLLWRQMSARHWPWRTDFRSRGLGEMMSAGRLLLLLGPVTS